MSHLSKFLFVPLLAACTGGTLEIDVSLPETYDSAVEQFRLSVYATDAIACDDIAYGKADADALASARVLQLSADRESNVPLDGIPRDGKKLVLVEALGEGAALVAAGCTPVDDIGGDVSVTVALEAASRVILTAGALDRPIADEVSGQVTDVFGNPLAGAVVRFALLAPNGQASAGETTADDMGIISIATEEALLGGPQKLTARARWGEGGEVSGFGAIELLFEASWVPSNNLLEENAITSGRIGPNGERGVAVLVPVIGGRKLMYLYYDPIGQNFVQGIGPDAVGGFALGLFKRPSRDVPFTAAITLAEFAADGSTTTQTTPFDGIPRKFAEAGPCDGAQQIIADFATKPDQVIDNAGDAVDSMFEVANSEAAELLGGACVTDPAGVDRRTLVMTGDEIGVLTDINGLTRGPAPGIVSAVSEIPRTDGKRLLAAAFSLAGIELAQYQTAVTGSRVQLVADKVDDVVSTPLSSHGADFDGDGEVDVAALLDFGRRSGQTRLRVFVSLSNQNSLVGLSPEDLLYDPLMAVVDFDQDGRHELVIVGAGVVRVIGLGPLTSS